MTGLALTVLAALALHQARATSPDRTARAYRRFCDKLARMGCGRQLHEGPFDYARRTEARFPTLAEPVQRITQTYVRLRYAGGARQSVSDLERMVRRFVPSRIVRQSGARY